MNVEDIIIRNLKGLLLHKPTKKIIIKDVFQMFRNMKDNEIIKKNTHELYELAEARLECYVWCKVTFYDGVKSFKVR